MKKINASIVLSIFCLFTFQYANAQSAADSAIIAQIKWNKQKAEKGVVWKQAHLDDLYNSQQEINILEIDLRRKNIDVSFNGLANGLKLTSDFVQEEGAIGGINGSYFDMKDGGSITYFKVNGEVVNESLASARSKLDLRLNGAIIIDADHGKGALVNVVAADTANRKWASELKAPDVMVCGPLLIMNDTLVTLSSDAFNNNRHPRSAVAIKDNKLILITVDGRNNQAYGMSLPELAFFLKQIGAEKALNLDGGGSTALVLNTKREKSVLNYPTDNKKFDHEGERPVANVILIKKK